MLKKSFIIFLVLTIILLCFYPSVGGKTFEGGITRLRKSIDLETDIRRLRKIKNELKSENDLIASNFRVEDMLSEFSQSQKASKAGTGPTQILVDPRAALSNSRINRAQDDSYEEDFNDSNSGFSALRELSQLQNGNNSGNNSNLDSGFFGGARVGSGVAASNPPAALPNPTATPRSSERLERLYGQARGYNMLYMMHPEARRTSDKQIDNMLKAEVQNLYLGVLVDGTFRKDFEYLTSTVRRIARAGRSLTLVAYFTNGATMRVENTRINSPFSNIDPTEFRQRIISDEGTRETFKDLLRPMVPVFQLNKRLNTANKNFAIPMLEDNLDDQSYFEMRNLTRSIFGDRALTMRNPCPGCWDGNTSNSFGDNIELHDPAAITTLGISDGYSMDGVGYALPGENSPATIPVDQVDDLAVVAAGRGLSFFGIWRFQRQGLDPETLGQGETVPDERTYEVPSDSALQLERNILRAGLSAIR